MKGGKNEGFLSERVRKPMIFSCMLCHFSSALLSQTLFVTSEQTETKKKKKF